MANSKKDEKKVEEKTEPTAMTAPAPSGSVEVVEKPPALVQTAFQRANMVVPTQETLDATTLAVGHTFANFAALANDVTISEAGREKIKSLVELVSPHKAGLEDGVSDGWKVPRLQVVQPTTSSPAKPSSAKPGDLYTTAGSLVERPFAFVPLYINVENVYFESPADKIPKCTAPDAKLGNTFGVCEHCPQLPFGKQPGKEQKITGCSNQVVVAGLAVELDQIVLITFSKTSRSAGSALVSLVRQRKHVWSQSYLLDTEKKSGAQGLYYILKIEPTGKDNPAEIVRIAEAISQHYEAGRKKLLAHHYYRIGSAGDTAVAGEAAFNEAGLAAGLDLDRDGGEPDLSAPAAPAGPARTASRPM